MHYKLKATLYNKGAFKSNLDGYAYLNVVRDEQGQRRMQHQVRGACLVPFFSACFHSLVKLGPQGPALSCRLGQNQVRGAPGCGSSCRCWEDLSIVLCSQMASLMPPW